MATETSRRGLARETGRGLRFAESATATSRRAPDFSNGYLGRRCNVAGASRRSRLRGLAPESAWPDIGRAMSIAGLSMRRIRARALHRVPMRRRRQLWVPSPPLTASRPSSTPPKPCPSAVSRRARLRPFLGPNEIDRAGQRTLAGVAFRRRARGTPRLRPTRARRIVPRRGVSLEEEP